MKLRTIPLSRFLHEFSCRVTLHPAYRRTSAEFELVDYSLGGSRESPSQFREWEQRRLRRKCLDRLPPPSPCHGNCAAARTVPGYAHMGGSGGRCRLNCEVPRDADTSTRQFCSRLPSQLAAR